MQAYVVVQFTPKDQRILKNYSVEAAATMTNFEGKFLVKSEVKTLVGESGYKYSAIIAFPSLKLAQSWFNSSEYQGLTELRGKAMDATFLLAG